MLKIFALAVLWTCALCAPAPQVQSPYEYSRPVYTSNDQLADAKPQPYDFGYEVKDELGSVQSRQESADGSGAVKGTYGYHDPNGVFRQVDYIADEYGFRVNVKTNEPGTSNQSPADVVIVAEEPPAGVLVQKVVQAPLRVPSGPVVIPSQGIRQVQVRPAGATVVGVRPAQVKVVSPVQSALYPVHHNIVPVSTPVHVVHGHHSPVYAAPSSVYAAPSPVYVSAPTVVKPAIAPAATHAVYKTGPVGAAVVRSYGPF